MTSLLNRFTIIGILKECRIDLFPSHIKARFNIEIDKQQEITIYYSINKKFHKEKYKEFIDLIPHLHPTINGYVWNGKTQYYRLSSNNLLENSKQKLFISGNILEKNGFVYFNAEYIKITKKINKGFLFEFEGIVVDEEHILNIVNDSPRVFNIKTNINPSEKIYNDFRRIIRLLYFSGRLFYAQVLSDRQRSYRPCMAMENAGRSGSCHIHFSLRA